MKYGIIRCDPNTRGGTLNYTITAAFNDMGNDNANFRSQNISILGFRKLEPVQIQSGGGGDLVPFSPLGNFPNAFCRVESGGKKLRVTIKNIGQETAGPTKTKVSFGNEIKVLDTPEIGPGKTSDLLFDIPSNCFNPDCDFIIQADSDNNVNEGSAENNNTVNGICIG